MNNMQKDNVKEIIKWRGVVNAKVKAGKNRP